jgi:hypothetical protein
MHVSKDLMWRKILKTFWFSDELNKALGVVTIEHVEAMKLASQYVPDSPVPFDLQTSQIDGEPCELEQINE